MLGLCHVCLTSGVPLQITKGLVHCANCIGINAKKDEEKKETKVLDFEELPQATPEERSENIKLIAADVFDRHFHRKMNSERVNEVN